MWDVKAPANRTPHSNEERSRTNEDGNDNCSFVVEESGGNSAGIRYIFEVVQGSDKLRAHEINARVKLNEAHPFPAFIECTQFTTTVLKRNCKGAMIAFSVDGQAWHFGVIESLAVWTETQFDSDGNLMDGLLSVFKWGGSMCEIEGSFMPLFYRTNSNVMQPEDLKFESHPFTKN